MRNRKDDSKFDYSKRSREQSQHSRNQSLGGSYETTQNSAYDTRQMINTGILTAKETSLQSPGLKNPYNDPPDEKTFEISKHGYTKTLHSIKSRSNYNSRENLHKEGSEYDSLGKSSLPTYISI